VNWIKEKIYGNYAVVYHRTRFNALAEAMYTEGFKPGDGDMYGKGFYATYELESQESGEMASNYGPIILKAAVPIDKFVFFDWEAFTKTPQAKELNTTEAEFIRVQCERFEITPHATFDWETVAALSISYHSSDVALYVVRGTDLLNRAAGIVFTGRRDGHVLVAYRTELVMPLAVRPQDNDVFTKVPHDQAYLARMLKVKLAPTISPIEPPSWLQRAKKRDAKITMMGDEVHWKDGIWIDGEWLLGEWGNGSWMGGTWNNGTWLDGTWYDGLWKKGRWGKGTWYGGVWQYGNWANGVWVDGTWRDGDWMQGTWKKGTWHAGRWEGGTWRSGVWKDGLFFRGDWLDGEWHDGYHYNGRWYNGVWHGGTWFDGIWYRGTWEAGYWARGVWKDGVWKGGTWSDGTWERGIWMDGVWVGGSWKEGWIHDPQGKGNLQPEWERLDGWTLSPISPVDYWDAARMVLK